MCDMQSCGHNIPATSRRPFRATRERPTAHPINSMLLRLAASSARRLGSLAAGLFNLAEEKREITVSWTELGISGKHKLRDLWRHEGLGEAENEYTAHVARHGVQLVRFWPAGDGR